MDKPFDLNRFTTGRPAYVRLADNQEATVTPAPLAAVGNYFGIALIKRGEEILDYALFTSEGRLNTGLQMYMKGNKKKGWINIYSNTDGRGEYSGSKIAETRDELLTLRDSARAIAQIEIEYEV